MFRDGPNGPYGVLGWEIFIGFERGRLNYLLGTAIVGPSSKTQSERALSVCGLEGFLIFKVKVRDIKI